MTAWDLISNTYLHRIPSLALDGLLQTNHPRTVEDLHVLRLLHIPSPSPLALRVLVTCQSFQVNLISLPLPAYVFRAFPSSHGETQVSRALLDRLPTILGEAKELLVNKNV